MNNNNVNNQTSNYTVLTNEGEVNQTNNQTFMNNTFDCNNNLNQNNMNMQNNDYLTNNTSKKNNNNKKIILIALVSAVIIVLFIVIISLLSKSSSDVENKNNEQNQINDNKIEDTTINEEHLDNNKNEDIIENEKQSNNNDAETLPNTNIIKRSLGQVSAFDNGISINVTDSIEYADDKDFYHKPMFIKVEISNDSNKNFYQSSIGYSIYSTYTENPIEFISEDFDYTSFDIIPMYLLGDEVKTDGAGCVLRKTASMDTGTSDGYGGFSDINYLVLKPGEKTTAYLLCYFREELEGAEIKTIYLLKSPNEFMYYIN